MTLLLLDNHDSFSAILRDYLRELTGESPLFLRNDALTRDELEALDFDAAVLSPGPGHPANVRDFGVCRDLLELFPRKPVLGVCLGMQGMAHFAGATVSPLAGALHGRPGRILHDGSGIFAGLPSPFTAVRYHSLVVREESLPPDVSVTARSGEDDQVMGVSFAGRPWFGVQFHPESVGTEHGKALLRNFLDLAMPGRPAPVRVSGVKPEAVRTAGNTPQIPHLELPWKEPADAFLAHLADAENAFWLDGPGWGAPVMGRADRVHAFAAWEPFAKWLASLGLDAPRAAPWEGYRGGPVGHLAYELYRDTLGVRAPDAGKDPLARWMLPEGWLAFDREARKAYAAWEGAAPPAWLKAVMDSWDVPAPQARAAALPPFAAWTPSLPREAHAAAARALQDAIARGDTYEACLTHAYAADSDADPAGVYLRLRARNPAPYAAYFAFADARILSASPELFLERSESGMLRSRPIKGTRRRGADAVTDRALRDELARSEKDAAENRMIVDLTRHDFCRACAPGSVSVPAFLDIEAHPAVFQMVSEVRGDAADARAADAVAACFPGGSMTGAPKERTVEILAGLEPGPRGIYSGALGHFTRGAAFSLSMVIRTLENRGARWRTGCGGAILADSDPDAEWREAVVKARSVLDAAGA